MKKIISLFSVLALCAFTFLQDVKKITGSVVDEQGYPAAGITVLLKGTRAGTVTDANGNFTIAIPANIKKPVLVFSGVGYESYEFKIKDNNTVKAVLKKAGNSLGEVVITTGNRRASKKKLSESELYKNQSVAPVAQALQGSVAGIQINGAAGSASTIRVRGISTLQGSSNTWHNPSPKKQDYKRIDADKDGKLEDEGFDREGYERIVENDFLKVNDNPLSTFSIDVDAASYSNIRRMLNSGSLPPHGAVRIEEMINYFKYQYPQPLANKPFSVNTELTNCPWNTKHQLALIGLQGKQIQTESLPASNLTFLIDVSGSMESEDKLPLVISSLKLLTDQLREQDKISIVVYAGNAGLVLPPTSGSNKSAITNALERLHAGGSTAGGAGIQLAYKTAKENFVKNGNNRVILCTDGDFNVGTSSDDELERMIEEERKSGVFLTVLGFGTGNYQDAKMQKLADKGNGNHAYIDNLNEAKKVLVSEFGGTLFTIAKDVKLQIEFNPGIVKAYRLIGYENRMLAKEDFNNDKKDAGELGSGHTVTALYEIIPAGVDAPEVDTITVDALKYQKTKTKERTNFSGEIMNIKLRYKKPDEDVSKLTEVAVANKITAEENVSNNLRFAAAVAQFGLVLRDSKFKGNAALSSAKTLAQNALGNDSEGYRKEFLELLNQAEKLMGKKKKDVAIAD